MAVRSSLRWAADHERSPCRSLFSQIARRARRDASAVAVEDCGTRYSYGHFLHLVEQLSDLLPDGATVGVIADEGVVVPLAELSCARLQACSFLPMDPTWPHARLRYMIQSTGTSCCVLDASAEALLGDDFVQDILRDMSGSHRDARRPACDLTRMALIVLRRCDPTDSAIDVHVVTGKSYLWLHSAVSADLPSVALLSDMLPGGDDVVSLGDFDLGARGRGDAEDKAEELEINTQPSCSPLYLIFTSGSTGWPKAVVGTEKALHTYLASPAIVKRPGDRVLLCSAVTWDPSVSDIFSTFLGGATLILEPRARLMSRLDLCIEERVVSHCLSTPALWRLLFAGETGMATHRDSRLPSLRLLMLGGEAWRPSDTFVPAGLRDLYDIYGVTECTIYQTISRNLLAHDVLEPGLDQRYCRPLNPSVLLRVTEDEELLIGGPQALSYLGDGAPHEKFFTEIGESGDVRWFHTGDRCSSDLRIQGRLDHQVKLNGFRIELGEIEGVLEMAVAAAVCVFVKDAGRLVAFVRATMAAERDAADAAGVRDVPDPHRSRWEDRCVALRCYCESRMPRHQIPHEFLELPAAVPLTSSGKVDRQRLVEDHVRPSQRSAAAEAEDQHKGLPMSRAGEGSGQQEWAEERSHPALDATEGDCGDTSAALATPFEVRVAKAWAEALDGIDASRLSPLSHFFELGGNSSMAVRMVALLAGPSENAEMLHRRLCGLIRHPRLREYARFVAWVECKDVSVGNPTSASAAPTEVSRRASLSTEMQTFYRAVEGGDLFASSVLVLGGVDVNGGLGAKEHCMTPLMAALSSRSCSRPASIVALLLEARADANRTTIDQRSALLLGAEAGTLDSDVLGLLLRHRAAVGVKDEHRWSALHFAAAHGSSTSVAALLSCAEARGALLNSTDRWRKVPLHYAVERDDIDICKQLLDCEEVQVDFKAPGRARRRRNDVMHWEPPMHTSIRLRSLPLLKLLIARRCHPNKNRADDAVTPLHYVLLNGRSPQEYGDHVFGEESQCEAALTMLGILLEAGADPNALDVRLRSPVFYVPPRDPSALPGSSPLSSAGGGAATFLETFRHAALRKLLDAGARPDLTDARGMAHAEFHEKWREELEREAMESRPGERNGDEAAEASENEGNAAKRPASDVGDGVTVVQTSRSKDVHSDLSALGGPKFQVKGRFNLVVDIKPPTWKKAETKKNQCFRCLEFGHRSADCTNPAKCRSCGGPHETREHAAVSTAFDGGRRSTAQEVDGEMCPYA